jgi:hypothetical protein
LQIRKGEADGQYLYKGTTFTKYKQKLIRQGRSDIIAPLVRRTHKATWAICGQIIILNLKDKKATRVAGPLQDRECHIEYFNTVGRFTFKYARMRMTMKCGDDLPPV